MLTEKQRLERKLGIGGSDVPVIFGLSQYKTPYQLYLEKTQDALEEQPQTQLQYWGSMLEPILVKEFEIRNQVTVQTPETIIHPFYNFMRANVDGIIPELNAVLEVKCSSSFMKDLWGEDGTDVIPMQYLLQVAHYCSVTNADMAYIAVLIGGNEYRQFKYTRDEALEIKIIEECSRFWECVVTKNAPPPTKEIDLRLLYPNHKESKSIVADSAATQEISTMRSTRTKIKELEDIDSSCKFNIMNMMQDAEQLIDSSGKPLATWRTNKSGKRIFLMKGE